MVLLEDSGALVGLVFALTGVGLTMLTGDPVWDGVGTVAIGVLLGVIAVILMVEMHSLLIGEGATKGEDQGDPGGARADRQHRPADPSAHAVSGSRGTAGRREDRARRLRPIWPPWPPPSTLQKPRSVRRCPPRRLSTWNQISIGTLTA